MRPWRSLESHPWLWTLALLAPLTLIPQIDLTVSGWFFDPATRSFPARIMAVPEWFRREMPVFLFAAVGLLILAGIAGEFLRRPLLGMTRRACAFIILSLALGPGLVVNVVLKDYWGRPRPSTIVQFGGTDTYVPPLLISDQCDRNCSFASGHGALGFWPVALALLAPPAWRRPAMAAALLFGGAVGLVRIAQGGHFLSDVAFAAFITVGMTLRLHRWLVAPAESAREKNYPPILDEGR